MVSSSAAAKLVQKVNSFMKYFVLHQDEHHHLHQSDAAVLCTVMYESCPQQLNGFDCGIFAVTVCLYLSEQQLVDTTSFEQSDATLARMLLGKCFTGKNMLVNIDNTTSRHFRGCFPLLCGGQRIHYIGANSDSAVSTRVKVKVRSEAKVHRSGIMT